VLADHPAKPSAESEATHPGGADVASRSGKAKDLEFVIYILPGGSASDSHGSCSRIHVNALHGGEIDDQPVAKRDASDIVAAATNGGREIVFAGKVDGSDYVGDTGAPEDEKGVLVDHGVVDLAGVVVARIGRQNQLSAE
jgi:hypothetical protein